MALTRERRRIPSLANFARSGAESRYPDLWNGALLLLAPSLGFQGQYLQNLTRRSRPATLLAANGYDGAWIPSTRPDAYGGGRMALRLNRSGVTTDRLQIGDNTGVSDIDTRTFSLTKDFTIMGWGNLQALGGAALSAMFSKGVTGSSENYSLYVSGSGSSITTVTLEYFTGSFQTITWTLPALSSSVIDTWHHYAMVFGDGNVTFYFDGNPPPTNGTQTLSVALTANANPLYMGGVAIFSNPWRGFLDDLRIYNRRLNPNEILTSAIVDMAPYLRRARMIPAGNAAPGSQTVVVSPAKMQWQAKSCNPSITTKTISPTQEAWQVQAPTMARTIQLLPTKVQWKASTGVETLVGQTVTLSPAQMQWRAQVETINRFLSVNPAREQWRASTSRVSTPFPGNVIVMPRPRRLTPTLRTPNRGGVTLGHPLAQGLRNWFLAESWTIGSRTWYDLLNGADGQVSGNVALAGLTSGFGSTVRTGGRGELRFDGSNDKVDMALPWQTTPQYTLAFWMNPSPQSSTEGTILIQASTGDGLYYEFGTGQIDWFDSFDSSDNFSSFGLTAGIWNHVAITVANSGITFYLNGLKYNTISPLTGSAQATLNRMGLGRLNTQQLNGALDDVRFYTRALSPTTIAAVYVNSMLGSPGLLNRFRFPYIVALSGPLNQRVAVSPSREQWQASTLTVTGASTTITISAARIQWSATTGRAVNSLPISPTKEQWAAQSLSARRAGVVVSPSRQQWKVSDLRALPVLAIEPCVVAWKANTVRASNGVAPRDCGVDYDVALNDFFLAGDWLVQIPALNVFYSFHFENVEHHWSHQLLDITDIEIAVPMGGGLAEVSNVTVKVIEDDSSDSLLKIWERAATINGVEITIDFVLDGFDTSLRMFTGAIDSITILDAVSSINCVDHSVLQNLQLPRNLIDPQTFPDADSGVQTQPQPLVYGRGADGGAVPLLLVDIGQITYLVAGHTMTLGSDLAVFEPRTSTYLTLPNVIDLPTQATSSVTLGTLDTGIMTVQQQLNVPSATNVVDGNPFSLATVYTNTPNSNGIDGIGYLGVTPGRTGYPLTDSVQITFWNHRRSPGSDPTVTGTFELRTIDPVSFGALRSLYTSIPFNHVTSAQTNVVTVSNAAVGINELLEVYLLVSNAGAAFNASQTYQVGEISITPLVVYSTNVSGQITAVNLGINLQELRFNTTSLTRMVAYADTDVTNAALAIDGDSTTYAFVGTSLTDSNLDGIGQLIIATSASPAQRGNNTVLVNFENHKRATGSDPTVTGTFDVRTINAATGTIARGGLFTTQAFRQSINPQTTSFVITSLNLGANEQLAVRLLARNEGGPGTGAQYYQVGEIYLESFYQPSGDNALYLFGPGWEGRRDPDGSVTSYAGLGEGTLLIQPDEIIASFLVQECFLPLDVQVFAQAYNFFATNAWIFDGGVGAKWSVTRTGARDILRALAIQSTSILTPTFSGQWGLLPYRSDQPSRQSFTINNILSTEGAETQPGDQRNSTFQVTMGNMQDVHSRFEIHYAYNVANGKYDKLLIADAINPSLPDTTPDRGLILGLVAQSFARFGPLEPMIIQAYWIYDDTTAGYLLSHVVRYFSQQRLVVEFETTFLGMCLQVGDFITITYPALPALDNGKDYEIHSLRYMPSKGRIRIRASKVATLGTLVTAGSRSGGGGPGTGYASNDGVAWKVFALDINVPVGTTTLTIETPSAVAWQASELTITGGAYDASCFDLFLEPPPS